MITKTVKRYWCEFCRKSGGSAGHMRRHEERCTSNPNRVCGMCKLIGTTEEHAPLSELIAYFPPVPDLETRVYDDQYIRAVEAAMPIVREKSGDCPACILAARKIAGVPAGISPYDFKAACASLWADFNEAARCNDW